jgi:hypothetical protein
MDTAACDFFFRWKKLLPLHQHEYEKKIFFVSLHSQAVEPADRARNLLKQREITNQ